MEKKWYQKNWVIIVFLFIFTPIGLVLLWLNKKFTPKTRKIISGVFTVYFVVLIAISYIGDKQDTQVVNNVTPTPVVTVEPTVEPTPKQTVETTPEPPKEVDENEQKEKEVYKHFNELLESKENPANWIEIGTEAFESDSNEYKEASAKWQQQVADYEEEATKETAKKFGITEDEVLTIFWTGASGDSDSSDDSDGYTIKYGELLEAIDNEDTLVIKAKIEPVLTNNQTIKQNYFNVEDIINNQGADEFEEIQYWAVADMTSGDEAKVISFTLNKDMITAIKKGNIVPTQYGDYVEDLYILPSLLE